MKIAIWMVAGVILVLALLLVLSGEQFRPPECSALCSAYFP
jgi:hypothetical protein